MKLLLDTHALLWWLAGDEQLARPAHDAIAQTQVVVVSAASAWEVGIKQALGKLTGPDDLRTEIVTNGFTPLEISVEHALSAAGLPPHHDDPFDRMLIAQARIEGLTLVSRDRRFSSYDVPLLAA